MYLREAVNRFRALIGAVTKLGLCICKFDSEKVSASPATNLTARHCTAVTVRTQPLLSGQPGLSMPAYFYCQVVLTQFVFSQCSLQICIRHCDQVGCSLSTDSLTRSLYLSLSLYPLLCLSLSLSLSLSFSLSLALSVCQSVSLSLSLHSLEIGRAHVCTTL